MRLQCVTWLIVYHCTQTAWIVSHVINPWFQAGLFAMFTGCYDIAVMILWLKQYSLIHLPPSVTAGDEGPGGVAAAARTRINGSSSQRV